MIFSKEEGWYSLRSKELGLGIGKNPRPNPKLAVLLVGLGMGIYCWIDAGWKLYENLLGGSVSFLLTGIMELREPIGFKGFDKYFLYELY